MNFKQWIENREILYSWLSPRGEFVPLNGISHMDHSYSLGLNIGDMWQKGWFRINYLGDKIYANNEKLFINDRQKKALIDAAIENNMNYIVYDSGEDEKIIWSKDQAF
jgi:hypothetical protein